jgi:ferredoxin/flavodoxin---NADP+ reductase
MVRRSSALRRIGAKNATPFNGGKEALEMGTTLIERECVYPVKSAAPPGMVHGILTRRIEVGPGLLILRVVLEDRECPTFLPGQYTVLGLPRWAPRCRGSDPEPPGLDPNRLIRRAYSIASSSRAHEYLEFYIRLVESGELTPRLFSVAVGQRLWVGRKITGMFTLQEVPPDKHMVLIATGTGIAPYMSMLRSMLLAESGRRLAVVHGARHSWDLGYAKELTTLERRFAQFAYLPILSSPEEESNVWRGRSGFCQDVWSHRELDRLWGFRLQPDNTHVFLCGNPLMIEAMLCVLAGEGFREHSRGAPGQIHLEKYW